jgi:integrase
VVDGPDGIVEQPATRKKRSGALVAIDPYTVATLQAHHDRQAAKAKAAGAVFPADAHLFTDDLLGERPWRPDTTSKRFRHVRNTIGLTCRLHDLRHLSATVLVAAGVDVRTVAQRGGWRKASTLIDRYAHAVDPADRAAADILGELLTRQPADDNVVELG